MKDKGKRGGSMYRLSAENLLLELEIEAHREDLQYPINACVGVIVSSYGFSAEAVLDMDIRQIAEFSTLLNKLYERLEGSVKLAETYGNKSFIEFTASTKGHITIRGNISSNSAHGYKQELRFENEMDQTDLRDFAKALFADWAARRYTKTC